MPARDVKSSSTKGANKAQIKDIVSRYRTSLSPDTHPSMKAVESPLSSSACTVIATSFEPNTKANFQIRGAGALQSRTEICRKISAADLQISTADFGRGYLQPINYGGNHATRYPITAFAASASKVLAGSVGDIDEFRRELEDIPTRPGAIRELVTRALKALKRSAENTA